MNAWNPKPFEREELNYLRTHKRNIQIARHRPIGVEGRSGFVVVSGDRTSSEDRCRVFRNGRSKQKTEVLEPRTISIEPEPDCIFELFFVGQFSISFMQSGNICHNFKSVSV